VFGLIGGGREPLRGVDEVVLRGEQVVQGGLGFAEERLTGGEVLGLLQQGSASAGVQADFAGVGLILASEDAHERRLAGPVRSDQPDALAVVKFELDLFEKRARIESARKPGAAQQQHAARIRFACRGG
jgi:hypothetical protein